MGDLPLPNAVTPPRPAAQHHHPRAMGRRRVDEVPEHRVRQRGTGGDRAPHRGEQRLRTAGLRGDRPFDLRVPHPHTGLVRHRLQRVGRQVRAGVRGPGGRHGQARRGRPHRRLQQEHLGGGDARQLRCRAADTDPGAHRRTAARLATGHGPRRPEGHSRSDLGRRFVHPLPAGCHPDPAVDLHPPRRRHHRMPGQRRVRGDGPDPRYRRPFQRTARPAEPDRSASRRRDPRQVGVDG